MRGTDDTNADRTDEDAEPRVVVTPTGKRRTETEIANTLIRSELMARERRFTGEPLPVFDTRGAR